MTAALSSSVMPVTGITYELVHDHTAGVGVPKRSPGGMRASFAANRVASRNAGSRPVRPARRMRATCPSA